MKRALGILMVLLIGFSASGQSGNYDSLREGLTKLTCGPVDSLTLVQTRKSLETFDTTILTSNIKRYYRDLGWCYYLLNLHTKDTAFIRMASNAYDKALHHDPNYSVVLWDKSLINYFFYKDCQKGKYYMDRFKKATRRKYWNKEQIKRFSQKC